MKLITALAAMAIVGSGAVVAVAAVAAEPPAAPSAIPVKQPSLKVCNKQADAKKLTGPARTQFVKGCHAGKPARTGSNAASTGSNAAK